MSWTDMLARCALTASAITISSMLAIETAHADVVVVKASGPSAVGYPAGKKLADRSTVNLKSGDTLILLDGRGTRTLRGPGIFGASAPTSSGTDTRNTFISLMTPRPVGRARTGAVRGGDQGGVKRNPSLWYVDITRPSTACVVDPTNVLLWRPMDQEAASVTASGGGKSATISFAAGNALSAWPSNILPVTDGARYTLIWKGQAAPVSIDFALMPGESAGLENTASALIARKCQAQLDLLVETVALPDAADDTTG